MNDRRTFPNAPASVSAARRFVLEAMGGRPAGVEEAAAIVVSELATNCVRHAGTEFTIDVDVTGDRLRVEVRDSGGGVPTLRSPDVTEPTGRGLLLVRELSDDWGVTSGGGADGSGQDTSGPQDASGKSVWFTLALSDPVTRALQHADSD